jgi:hypothetical protein
MRAYYDLDYCPPTFDTVTFLTWLEHDRIKRSLDDVSIEIVPGDRGGSLWPHTIEERRELVHTIVAPMCRMLPSCTEVVIGAGRPSIPGWGLGQYTIAFGHFMDGYRDGVRPLRPEHEGPVDPLLVTMTLRECDHWPMRNSKVEEWVGAAGYLTAIGLRVVIVRDTRCADLVLDGIETDPLASRNLEARASLYRSAALNLFVSNGPAWFCLALDAPALILRPATENTGFLYSKRGLASFGIHDQIAGAPAHQRLVWKDDTRANIVEAVGTFSPLAERVAEGASALWNRKSGS